MIKILDIMSVGISAFFLLFTLFLNKDRLSRTLKYVFSAFFAVSAVFSLLLFLEWSGIRSDLEHAEDLTGAVLPIFWMLIFFVSISVLRINDLKDREREIAEQHNRLELVIKGGALGTWDWDLGTGDVDFNDRWCSMLGYESGELTGSYDTWDSLLHPDDRDMILKALESYLEGSSETYEIEQRLRTKDGGWKWVLARGEITSRSPDGVPLRMSGTHLDISLRKKAETALKEKNAALEISLQKIQSFNEELKEAKVRAEESDKLKTAFLANLSHEIRTPMNGILGFADLLRLDGLSSEERVEFLNLISQSGSRMLKMIENLVDISLIESGQIQIKLEPVDLHGLLSEIIAFFKRDALLNKTSLGLEKWDESAPAILKTDYLKLHQIMMNLTSNALKFTENGTVTIGYRKDGDYLVFEVRDTGVGIPGRARNQIFERFQQAENSPFSAVEGLGLGLAISKAFVAALGGDMWYESTEGKGSVFFFTLPL